MAMALYEPGLGYYVRPETTIGQAGDFYTSAHLHPVFGWLMARQIGELWEALDRPSSWRIVEQGGGRGLFAADLLTYLRKRVPDLYDALRYDVVELSPWLKKAQEEALESHGDKVSWYPDLGAVGPFSGVHFSNELPDALPVHLVETTEEGLREVAVVMDKDGFAEHLRTPVDPEVSAYAARYGIDRLPPGYRTEVHLAAGRWLRQVADGLVQGYAIVIDYGFSTADYYAPDRTTGTLICYHRHRTNENPLERPGEQDITAHAHFTDLVNVGRTRGMRPLCFTSQGVFLISLGLDEIMSERRREVDEARYLKEAAQVRTLIMPDGMGESHKVLVLGKDVPDVVPRGCEMRNRLDYLLTSD